MKTVEERHEALENFDVMENFTVGNVTQNVKDYFLDFDVDDLRLLTSV